jgi:23S rRNA pseudouridine1911/1915/1917 synthase
VTTRLVAVDSGMPARLDALVRSLLPGASRRFVQRLFDEGAVRLNGRIGRKGERIVPGDRVELPAIAPLTPEPDAPLTVVYEDAMVVAIDKPGGVRGHALDPRQRGTSAAALLARYPEVAGIGGPLGAGLVHRLDTGTSGILLAARSSAAFDDWRAAFRARDVIKRYVAVVEGTPAPGVVDAPLAHDSSDRRRMRAARAGERSWPASSRIVGVAPMGARARIEVEIRTGVTHQVRAHLALVGHPIVGDTLYGACAAELPPGRHALHAASLARPAAGFAVEAPFPDDLAALPG